MFSNKFSVIVYERKKVRSVSGAWQTVRGIILTSLLQNRNDPSSEYLCQFRSSCTTDNGARKEMADSEI